MKEKKFKMLREPIKPIRNMEVKTYISDEQWLGLTTEEVARRWPGGTFASPYEDGVIEIQVTSPESLEEYGKRLEQYFTELAGYNNWRRINAEKIFEVEHKERLNKIIETKRAVKELEDRQRKTNQETVALILQKKKELERLEELQKNEDAENEQYVLLSI